MKVSFFWFVLVRILQVSFEKVIFGFEETKEIMKKNPSSSLDLRETQMKSLHEMVNEANGSVSV